MTKDEAISTERALDLAQGYLDGLIRSLNMDDTSEAVQVRDAIKQARSAPVQSAERGEHVGYVAENGVVDWNVCAPPILTDLYTTPPAAKRPWVGLTEEEISACDPQEEFWGLHEVVRRAEAKLRSKNI